MLRRFDVVKDENGKWKFKGLHPDLDLKNWALGIEPEKNQILVGCTSKAMKVINRCKSYPLKEGSLLLYTKPNIFFSIWHDKEFQDVLDRYNILSMRPVKMQYFDITVTKLNHKIINPVMFLKDVKLLAKKKLVSGETKQGEKSEIYIIHCEMGDSGYIIQRAFKINNRNENDERILYIHKGISYKQLPLLIDEEKDYLEFSKVFNEIDDEDGEL